MMSPLRTSDEIVVGEAGPSRETVRGRSGAIDGLRALAISAIVVYEIVRLAPALVAGNGVWTALAFDASQGLTLFLILSGYTLAYPAIVACVENGRAHFDVGRFIVKRLSRIYPSYLAALGLAIALPPLAVLYGVPALAGGPGRPPMSSGATSSLPETGSATTAFARSPSSLAATSFFRCCYSYGPARARSSPGCSSSPSCSI